MKERCEGGEPYVDGRFRRYGEEEILDIDILLRYAWACLQLS